MAPSILKKRKIEEGITGHTSHRPKKSRRKQSHYSSPSPTPSADEFAPVDLADSEHNSDAEPVTHSTSLSSKPSFTKSSSASDSDSSASDSSASGSSISTNPNHTLLKPRKRNDPAAFSASISAILNSKLTTSKRNDPVLARSTTAQQASQTLSDQRLETKAKRHLLADKKLALEKGRVRDVLLGTDAVVAGDEGAAGEYQEQERRLRKTAQRGVVKLFNAVRQAQVRGEEAARSAKGGRGRKEEKVNEMSREGFLELVAGGGRGRKAMGKVVEEA